MPRDAYWGIPLSRPFQNPLRQVKQAVGDEDRMDSRVPAFTPYKDSYVKTVFEDQADATLA